MNYYKEKYVIPVQKYKNSFDWGQSTLSLPLFPSISDDEQSFVISVLLKSIEPLIG
jgi:dTDP-4-amino-4,6-dideoxygalactose transaminase